MALKNRFNRIDAFTKTVEDARIRTTSGGVVTLSSILIILWLIWGEWVDYRRVVVKPELIVDKGRGEKMEIFLNVTFPRVPCELLTLDVMDVSGEVQTGVMHGVNKVRLSPEAEGSHELEIKALELHQDDARHMDPTYCGECYGAPAPDNAKKAGCCNTCDEVREAYAGISWSFGRGEGVEQCQREHYAERLDAQRKEGCRIEGTIRVNKVVGNFHFAPGKSFSNGNLHVHDLDNYFKDDASHSFTHYIHSLRFGPPVPDSALKAMSGAGGVWTNHHLNPLDGTKQVTEEKAYNYMYFVKVVSTAYLPLGWEKHKGNSIDTRADSMPHEWVSLGNFGHGEFGSIETNQYSVTSHKRSVHGGSDEKEGHKERLHARGGIPGVFFSYTEVTESNPHSITQDSSPLPPPLPSAEADAASLSQLPWIQPPLHVDYGSNLQVAAGVFINFNFTCVDTCAVTIGARTLIGPNVSIFSGTHPLDPAVRRGTDGPESGREVVVGEDCWIGGNAIVLPGVRLGRGVVVGAGSVVTKDVPDFWVVAGNPARMLRKIETTMDPEHPSNQRPVDLGGAEKAMADRARDIEMKGNEYHDDEQGW